MGFTHGYVGLFVSARHFSNFLSLTDNCQGGAIQPEGSHRPCHKRTLVLEKKYVETRLFEVPDSLCCPRGNLGSTHTQLGELPKQGNAQRSRVPRTDSALPCSC